MLTTKSLTKGEDVQRVRGSSKGEDDDALGITASHCHTSHCHCRNIHIILQYLFVGCSITIRSPTNEPTNIPAGNKSLNPAPFQPTEDFHAPNDDIEREPRNARNFCLI
ncbi:hypothetical protein CDAR_17941 [Caerostris darwini]|uniref:Uncharacterized protein n=1 Tax=Caerostris darwini TaxID=1538125 RepID=A0AAV4UGC8_9ARAC|nr:hypothetical protein CDAR_17941 [Caerostris darwini]